MTAVDVRRLAADEWRTYRDVRLRSLAESPAMFGSDVAREEVFDEATWRERTPRASIAAVDGATVGTVGWFWSDDDHRTAHLVAMWVDPAVRGAGVGAALIAAVVEQAATAGAEAVDLDVLAANPAGLALYTRAGFVETGRRVGSRSGELLIEMRRPVSPGPTAGDRT